jgi:hypothetical protein
MKRANTALKEARHATVGLDRISRMAYPGLNLALVSDTLSPWLRSIHFIVVGAMLLYHCITGTSPLHNLSFILRIAHEFIIHYYIKNTPVGYHAPSTPSITKTSRYQTPTKLQKCIPSSQLLLLLRNRTSLHRITVVRRSRSSTQLIPIRILSLGAQSLPL